MTDTRAGLHELQVIDLGLGMPAGLVTKFLREGGARITRVEPPTGDPFYGVNLALFKTTNLTENLKLEFRVEAANLLNRRNFGVPDPITEDAYLGGAVGSFQNPGWNNGSQRELRLGLRFIF